MNLRMRSAKLLAGLLGGTLLPMLGFSLWSVGALELPPVAVRSFGRVAGVVAAGVPMDVQLPVAWHRQEHSLSCEVAALKMALNHAGVAVSEAELIARLPVDPTPKRSGVWGNPNKGFVGNIDGKMLADGYGVYWGPIAELGGSFRRTEILRNSTAAEVGRHVAEGRPVIVWGYSGRYQPVAWRDAAGNVVQAVDGEHARVVTGFRGPASAPTHFALLDPIFGELTWTVEKFMENWTSLGRHGVVVYAARS